MLFPDCRSAHLPARPTVRHTIKYQHPPPFTPFQYRVLNMDRYITEDPTLKYQSMKILVFEE